MTDELKTLKDLVRYAHQHSAHRNKPARSGNHIKVAEIRELRQEAIKRAKHFWKKENEAFAEYKHENNEFNWGLVRFWQGKFNEVCEFHNITEEELGNE